MTFEFGPEDNVFTIGAYLKKVREEKKIKLDDVSTETKIHSRFLRALEEDDEENYPDDVYRGLFLKSYAEYLGIDLEEVMLRLPDRVKKKKKKANSKKNEKTTNKAVSSGNAKSDKKDMQKTPITPLAPPGKNNGFKLTRLIVIIVVIIAVIFVAYTKLIKTDNGESEVSGLDTIKTVVEEIPETTKLIQNHLDIDTMYLLFVGIDSCWLGVEIDGDSVFDNIISSSDTVRFALQKSASFKLGRANSIEGWLNGLPLKLGNEDDSSTVQYDFTTEDFGKLIDSAKLIP